MRFLIPLLALGASVSASAAPAAPVVGLHPNARVEAERAPWIFNAVVNAGRQWGAGLHHNGMGLMVATIPKGTLLYHGTRSIDPVNGSEWLAFEPEHALVFARSQWQHPPRRPPGPPPGHGPPPDHPPPPMGNGVWPPPPGGRPEGQLALGTEEEENYGYLHTYRTKHELTVLYLDGMSAGKTGYGTTDTQDHLLLDRVPPRQPMGGERARKEGLCELYAKHASHLAGTVRTEAGFELILCDFARHVGPPERVVRARSSMAVVGWVGSVAQRYNGLGARLRLHWQSASLFSAFSYDVPLFDGPTVPPGNSSAAHIVPRLDHLSSTERAGLRAAVLDWLPASKAAEGADWQAAADELVQRYALPLRWLAGDANATEIDIELRRLLRPFAPLDPAEEEGDEWCVLQAVPDAPDGSVAGRAVHRVAREVCSTLRRARVHAEAGESEHARTEIQQLIAHLDWVEFKTCRPGCAVQEVCIVPMWPLGSVNDWLAPTCRPKHAPYPPADGPDYWSSWHG